MHKGRYADERGADAGGEYAESDKVGERVYLNSEPSRDIGTVDLSSCYLAVECVAQTAEEQKEAAYIGMTGAAESSYYTGARRQQREKCKYDRVVVPLLLYSKATFQI